MANVSKKRWSDIKLEELSTTISRRFIYGERVMIAEVQLKKGSIVPEHSHENEQVTWITKGELLFEIGGKEIHVREGEVLVIPSNTPHKATALEDTVDMDIFNPPRKDWIEGDDQYLRGMSGKL